MENGAGILRNGTPGSKRQHPVLEIRQRVAPPCPRLRTPPWTGRRGLLCAPCPPPRDGTPRTASPLKDLADHADADADVGFPERVCTRGI